MNRLVLMLLKNIHRLPWALGKLWHYAKHTDRYPESESWAHIHRMMQYLPPAGNVQLQVFGKENLPTDEGFLLCPNHQSLFDAIAISSTCHRPLGVVYKKELVNTPVIKQIALCTRSFAMDREDVRQSLTVIRDVTEQLQAGRSYVIFPEGTRSRVGNGLQEFHSGSFRCAVKAKCPVVPAALIDSYKVLDQKGSQPVTVQLHYLPPIRYEEYKTMKTTELAELVKSRIAEAIALHSKPQ